LGMDVSKIEQVDEKLQYNYYLDALAARARDHVVESGNWSYGAFIEEFDRVVAEEADVVRGPRMTPGHGLGRVERILSVLPLWRRFVSSAFAAVAAATGWELSRRLSKDPGPNIDKGLLAVRAALGDRELRPLLREGRRAGLAI